MYGESRTDVQESVLTGTLQEYTNTTLVAISVSLWKTSEQT